MVRVQQMKYSDCATREPVTLNDTTSMLSGRVGHDHADKHKQLPDEFVVSMQSTEQKQTGDFVGMQAHHHELQILLPSSSEECQTKCRDEHIEITKTMMDLSIIQHQAELEKKVGNEQQLQKRVVDGSPG